MALAIGLALSASRLPAAEWWTDLGARELMPTSTRPDAAKPHLRLLAPIHGVASGQIAVRTETPITSLRVSVPDFVGDGVVLPKDTLRIRYLTHRSLIPGAPSSSGPMTTLADRFIPSDSLLTAVMITAEVPVGTPAGPYSGSIEVRADDHAFQVPVTVTVADFVMPGRSDLDFLVSLMQSPAQLAYAYGVEPYGENHWEVIEASTRLLGDMGHHILFVPVLWHANTGSGPQMVVFHREGDGLRPDFSRLDRYFRLVARECGPQRWLVLGVWGRWLARARPGAAGLADTVHLTAITEDGRLEPLAWSSDYAAHEALWRAVYEGVAELAERHLGVAREQILLGFGDDLHPDEATDAFWVRIAPRSPGWEAWTHNYGDKGPRPAFFQVVDTAAPDDVNALLAWPPALAPQGVGTDNPQPFYISACRDVQHGRSPAELYYSIPDLAVAPQKTGHSAGLSRIGLDFWVKEIPVVDGPVVKGDGFARDGHDRRAHPDRVARNYRATLTAQGPEGALPLVHFEALREGIQAAQARVVIARAVAGDPDLRERFRPVLEAQWESGARHGVIRTGNPAHVREATAATLHAGWAPLFQAAADAQRILGEREKAEASAQAERIRRSGASPE